MVKDKVYTYDCIHRLVCKYAKYHTTCNNTCIHYQKVKGNSVAQRRLGE